MKTELQEAAEKRIEEIQTLIKEMRWIVPERNPYAARTALLEAADELEKLIGKTGP